MTTIINQAGKGTIQSIENGRASFLTQITMIWLLGTVVLLPMNIINLPMNMTLVDYWILIAMPVLWLFVIRGSYPISLSYTITMWVILFGSLASTFAAPKPSNSLIVILKEIYVYIWFVTLTAVISRLKPLPFRRLMNVWTGVVLLHGVLIIAQFLSPDLWRSISGIAGFPVVFENYRPSGLFICDTAGCANRAAYYQLLGFVPLMLTGFSKRTVISFGTVLFLSILATGSMGAITAISIGMITAGIAFAVSEKRFSIIIKYSLGLITAVALITGILFVIISQNQQYQEHFQSIVVGRAGRSSEGRFELWSRGLDVLTERPIGLWGIGPENFRVIDWQGKQLHNDLLAFLVERGLFSTLGLIGFALIATIRAVNILLLSNKSSQHSELVEIVFLAVIVATLVESLTHQIFHDRELWLVLALQESILYKLKSYVDISLTLRHAN